MVERDWSRPQKRALQDAVAPVSHAEFDKLKAEVEELKKLLHEHRHGYRWEQVGKDGRPPNDHLSQLSGH